MTRDAPRPSVHPTSLRFTAEEQAIVRTAADAMGLSVSAFLRRTALAGARAVLAGEAAVRAG
jgi:uncharacterized protein (DUF1778 family)